MAQTTTKKQLREGPAASLGLLTWVTCNANAESNNKVITCPDLADKVVDNERIKSFFIWRTEDEWRRVASTDVPNATITVSRGFSDNNTANVTFGLYGVLSPDEWSTAINAAVNDKFYKDRIVVALVAGQKEYTPNADWLQSKGQIIRMRWRDESSGATKPAEDEVAVAYPTEANHTVKIIVPSQPTVTNTSLVIEARHYYGGLAADNASVTLPARLAEAAVKHEALKLIFQKMGPSAKAVFGQQMVLTERELHEQEARWMDPGAKRDWSSEDEPYAGDWEQGGPSWGW